MFRNFAPKAIGISAAFDECLALALRHGFKGIDLPLDEPDFSTDPEGYGQRVRNAGLRWGGFGLPLDFRGEEGPYQTGLKKLETQALIAKRAGCTKCYTWIMPAHNTLDYAANFEQHTRRLQPVAQLLAENGIRLAIEFVGPATIRKNFRFPFVHDIDGILELAGAIGHDTGVLFDCFHWFTSGGTRDDITRKLRGKVVYVHVNDARTGRLPHEQIDNERALPGATGVIDIGAFLGGLHETGYDGPVAAEPFLPELAALAPDETAARVAASFKKISL
ncbi:MAG: sugar phosphate isomerase/epimerase [Phycisphaeraceae bacterium]|nr:sugar phosphate isomerase/epimerase [Phycisphaeraceae bacterium]